MVGTVCQDSAWKAYIQTPGFESQLASCCIPWEAGDSTQQLGFWLGPVGEPDPRGLGLAQLWLLWIGGGAGQKMENFFPNLCLSNKKAK